MIKIPAEYAVRIVGVLGIRVGTLQLESAAEAPIEAELQGVIQGRAIGSHPELELPEAGIPARRVGSEVFAPVPDFRGQRVIPVVAVELMIGMGPGIGHGDRGFRSDLLLDAEGVSDLGGVFHVVLQPVTDDLGQRWSREEARVQSGKGSCGPGNPGGHAVGGNAAQGAVQRLRHQVIKVHPESTPDRCLAIGPRVPGKADARAEIFVRTLVPRLS